MIARVRLVIIAAAEAGVHAEGLRIDVCKHRLCTNTQHRRSCSEERERWHDDFVIPTNVVCHE